MLTLKLVVLNWLTNDENSLNWFATLTRNSLFFTNNGDFSDCANSIKRFLAIVKLIFESKIDTELSGNKQSCFQSDGLFSITLNFKTALMPELTSSLTLKIIL